MQNRNKMFSEVSRMIELSSHGSSNEKIIKESFDNKVNKSKKLIKEQDEDGFEFDLEDELNSLNGNLSQEEVSKSNEELPFVFKLALLSNGVSGLQANALNLAKEDIIELPDLKASPVRPEREGGIKGAIVHKPGFGLYSPESMREFSELLAKGKLAINYRGKEEGLDDRTFKWLKTRDFNNIPYVEGKNFKLGPKGKATVDFLARIASGQPKGDDEIALLDNLKDAKSYAHKILQSFYRLAGQNVISTMISGDVKNIDELFKAAQDGVNKALNNLFGIIGSDKNLRWREEDEDSLKNKYNPSLSVGPWIFQIAKNHVKDVIKSNYRYVPNLSLAQSELERRMVIAKTNGQDAFAIPSAFRTDEHNASRVESAGNRFLYYYDDVNDALYDLEHKAPHMRYQHLFKEELSTLFDNIRKAPESVDRKDLESGSRGKVEPKDSFSSAESAVEIKKLIGDAVEWMINQGSKYRLKAKQSKVHFTDQELKPGNKEKAMRNHNFAHKNLVNFIYDFLIQMGGSEDIEASGKAKSEFLKKWIDDYNLETLNQAMSANPNKSEEEIIGLMKGNGFWINDNESHIQALYNGLKDYFGAKENGESIQNKEVFDKILNLISGADFGAEREKEDIMFENEMKERLRRKIRQKLMESFTLEEKEDNIFDIDIETISTVGEKFRKFLKGEQYNDVSIEELNNEVKNVLDTGRGKYNLDSASSAKMGGTIDYILSVAASLYELVDKRKKDNIVKYIFTSLFPKGENSNAGMNRVSSFSQIDLKKPLYREIAWDSVTRGSKESGKTTIEEALEDYNPERAASFMNWVFNKIAGKTKSRIQKHFSRFEKGKYIYQDDVYSDDPLGSGEDSGTVGDKLAGEYESDESEGKNQAKKIISAYLDYMNMILGGKQALKDILNLFGNEAMYHNGKLDNKLIANELDASVGSIRKNKAMLNQLMRTAFESGDMRDYVLEKSGKDIDKYPKIQHFLKTGDFAIGDYNQNYDNPDNDTEDEDGEFEEYDERENLMYESILKELKSINS